MDAPAAFLISKRTRAHMLIGTILYTYMASHYYNNICMHLICIILQSQIEGMTACKLTASSYKMDSKGN